MDSSSNHAHDGDESHAPTVRDLTLLFMMNRNRNLQFLLLDPIVQILPILASPFSLSFLMHAIGPDVHELFAKKLGRSTCTRSNDN